MRFHRCVASIRVHPCDPWLIGFKRTAPGLSTRSRLLRLNYTPEQRCERLRLALLAGLIDDHVDRGAARPEADRGLLRVDLAADVDRLLGVLHRLLVDLENDIPAADAGAGGGGLGVDLRDDGTLDARGDVEGLAGLGIDVVNG